jgi:hypothetical protein
MNYLKYELYEVYVVCYVMLDVGIVYRYQFRGTVFFKHALGTTDPRYM